MLICITPDPLVGCWLRLRSDMPRIYCGNRAVALRSLEDNARGIVR